MTITAAPKAIQNPHELAEIVALYNACHPRRVLEIGVAEGGTLYHWLRGDPELVVAIDPFPPELFRVVADRRAEFSSWRASPNTNLELLTGRSDDPTVIAAAAAHGPFDWIHIDGEHSYDTVRQDWLTYRAMARPGAAVVFHDIVYLSDVARLWGEIKDGYETVEYVADDEPLGYGVVWL